MPLNMPIKFKKVIEDSLVDSTELEKHILEYVRLIFSNPDLTLKEYQNNELLEPTINKCLRHIIQSLKESDPARLRTFSTEFMRAVCHTNLKNWYLTGEEMEVALAHSQRDYFVFTKEWIPIIYTWYKMFRPYFLSSDKSDDGDSGNYYWANKMGNYLRRSLSAEVVSWWYDTFKRSVDYDGDAYMKYGLSNFLDQSTFAPIDIIVDFEKRASELVDLEDVMRWNYNLQTIEDFKKLNGLSKVRKEGLTLFTSVIQNNLDMDYYMMNRSANLEILEELCSYYLEIDKYIDWDYLSKCHNLTYDFMLKYGVVDWLKNTTDSDYFESLATIIVNPNLTESNIKDLCRKSLEDVDYINWEKDRMILDFLPLSFVKRVFEVEEIKFDDSNDNGFYYEYNCLLVAYLSNPNIEPRRNSLGELDFNFLTGSDSQDPLDCANHPATPFYFLTTSIFTNPAFTRQDLLLFLDYWKSVVELDIASPLKIGGHEIEGVAHMMMGTSYYHGLPEVDIYLTPYIKEPNFDTHGFILSGIFHAKKLQVADLVNYLSSIDHSNPMYQYHLLANPNIFVNFSVGLFNWWGSVVR